MSGTNPLSAALSQVTASQYNPVQAMGNALNVASKVYDLRSQQAQQAIGSILQQATDQNGNVDYEKAGQLAAQAGPVVQMGMQSYLQNASVMRGQQLAQGLNRNQAVGNAIIGALNGTDDGLHDRVVGGLQQLVSNGVMTQDQATRAALQLPSDAAGLRQRLTQLQTSLAPPDLQQQQISGRPITTTGPTGAVIGGTQNINTGAVTAPQQAGLPQGPDPNARYAPQEYDVPLDANGNVTTPDKAVRYQHVVGPRQNAPGFNLPQQQPTQPSSSSGAPPAPPGTTIRSPGFAQPRQQGGNTAPPAQPTPASSGQPGTPGGPALAGPPQGQPAQLQADTEARNKDLASIPQQQTQLQNMKHAYDALSFITTGKGQEIPNSLFNTLQGFGLLPQGAVNRVEKYEEYKKYATQAIIQQGLLQGTDLGRQLASAANPSDMLSTAANRELLRNNIGKAIQDMAPAAAEKDTTNPAAASGYIGRKSKIASNTDPRGFQWSLYSPDEQQKILADAAAADKRNGNTNASDRLHRAIGMASSIPALAMPFQQ